ncbi:MAG: AMP-binding protein, partial [Ktedonobacteraceae bacterium]|nr:AMP-binding protein [Ktedonobacteraceae bacterium]
MGMTHEGLSYWQAEKTGEPLLEMTVGNLLDRRASEFPDREAVVYSCYPEFGGALDIRWSYREYREMVDEVARGLLALGLKRGEHVAVWAANVPEWLLLQMAASKVGLVLVTVNPAYRAAELEYVLKQGDVAALFFMARIRDHDCLETVRSLVTAGTRYGEVSSERLPSLRYVGLIGIPGPGWSGHLDWRPELFREMMARGAYISEGELRRHERSVKAHDPVMMQYTSGTTGFPKGVVLTHYNIVNNAAFFASQWGQREGEHDCSAMPYFHVGGCVLAVLGTLYSGSTLHPMLAFDAKKMLQIISSERCTRLGAVPTMLMAMLQHPEFSSFDLSSLRSVVSGGAPVPVHLM